MMNLFNMINCRLTYEKYYYPSVDMFKLIGNYICCRKRDSAGADDEVVVTYESSKMTRDDVQRKSQNDL
jgi:hypothetical protein